MLALLEYSYLVCFPRFGQLKYDLDDYLSDNLGTVAPPAMWVAQEENSLIPTPRWIANLTANGDVKSQPRAYTNSNPIGEETADDGYPVHTTIFNVLPTVAAQNEPHIPEIHNSDTGAISQAITNQQQTAGVSGSNIFDLDIREVLGIDTGYRGKSPFGHYGDSEDSVDHIEKSTTAEGGC